jgi:LmbE family N-acetylglucosaminyl deacetylase
MRILTIIAHPDDETMLTGGALALLARAGADVHYLCATRGEGGEIGEPPLCTQAELGRVREEEMHCAVQALGGASLELLDYVDPTRGQDDELHPYTDDVDTLVVHFLQYIDQLKPRVVITHGSNGEYGHPAHKLTHQAVCSAVLEFGGQVPLLYTFSAAFDRHPRPRLANDDDPAHIVLDITPALPQKVAAALCHKTQHALFVRRSSKRAGRQLTVPEVIMSLEGLRRQFPVLNGMPDDEITRLLAPWYIQKM